MTVTISLCCACLVWLLSGLAAVNECSASRTVITAIPCRGFGDKDGYFLHFLVLCSHIRQIVLAKHSDNTHPSHGFGSGDTANSFIFYFFYTLEFVCTVSKVQGHEGLK